MKKFVIGDIHGAHKALLQCLERSGFNKEEDQLIVLGDVVDGWPEVKEVVDELLTMEHVIPIIGNHDEWFMDFVRTGYKDPLWTSQGGAATLDSYTREIENIKGDLKRKMDTDKMQQHMDAYFSKTHYYYIDEANNVFVHGGFDWHIPIEASRKESLTWDRHMYEVARYWDSKDYEFKFGDYNMIFIGHTTTEYDPQARGKKSTKPFMYQNLAAIDTGGGWSGKLTIMDVDTLEYWQSDLVPELYPDIEGRT
jgi:serine/threonine protein phosphatase 1